MDKDDATAIVMALIAAHGIAARYEVTLNVEWGTFVPSVPQMYGAGQPAPHQYGALHFTVTISRAHGECKDAHGKLYLRYWIDPAIAANAAIVEAVNAINRVGVTNLLVSYAVTPIDNAYEAIYAISNFINGLPNINPNVVIAVSPNTSGDVYFFPIGVDLGSFFFIVTVTYPTVQGANTVTLECMLTIAR